MSNITVNQLNAASVNISGGISMTGPFNIDKAINEKKGSDVAAASTTDIWSNNDGNLLHITGSGVMINSFGTPTSAGARRNIIIDGVLTIKNDGATMQLPGNTDYYSTPGDRLVVMGDSAANNIVFSYTKGDDSKILLLANLDYSLASNNTGGGSISQALQFLSPNGFSGFRELFIEVDKIMHTSNANATLSLQTTSNALSTWGTSLILTPNITGNNIYTSGTVKISGLGSNTDIGLYFSSILAWNSATIGSNSQSGVVLLPGSFQGLTPNGIQFGFIKSAGGSATNFKSGCIRIYGIK
jgi:hypothetical protein